MKRGLAYLSVVVCSAILLTSAGCGARGRKGKEGTVPVRVMKVELRDLSRILEYVGTIRGKDEAVVYPKVSGKISEKVREEGNPILKGEVLAYIDRDEVGLHFEKAPVESPLTGVVGRVYVDIGAQVTPQTPVALVSNMQEVKVDLSLPGKHLPDVSAGQKALITVDAYRGIEFAGSVTKISPVLDVETRAAPVEITIADKEGRLRSGMFAKVTLLVEEYKGVPVILKEAIIGREPETYVYCIEENRAVMRKVAIGVRQGPYFEVREGVRPGDLVVIMGREKLRGNIPVSVEVDQEAYSK